MNCFVLRSFPFCGSIRLWLQWAAFNMKTSLSSTELVVLFASNHLINMDGVNSKKNQNRIYTKRARSTLRHRENTKKRTKHRRKKRAENSQNQIQIIAATIHFYLRAAYIRRPYRGEDSYRGERLQEPREKWIVCFPVFLLISTNIHFTHIAPMKKYSRIIFY